MDLGDPKVVNDAKAEAGRAESARRVIWQTLLSHEDGRNFVWWLLSGANIFSSTFRGESTHASAFAEGARSFMIPIQAEIIRADPRGYQSMVVANVAKDMAERMKENERSKNSD